MVDNPSCVADVLVMAYKNHFLSLAKQLASDIAYHISVLQRTFPFTENLLGVDHDHSEQLARRWPLTLDASIAKHMGSASLRKDRPAKSIRPSWKVHFACTFGLHSSSVVNAASDFACAKRFALAGALFRPSPAAVLSYSPASGRDRLMVAIAAESTGKCKAMWCLPLVPSLLSSPSFAYLGTLSVNNLV